jgi:hypothetical protein
MHAFGICESNIAAAGCAGHSEEGDLMHGSHVVTVAALATDSIAIAATAAP